MYVFIFIFIVIILLFVKYNKEHFDAKIEQVNEIECGTMCTKTVGCAGFAYNDKKCWLGKQPILGRPEMSLYNEDYNPKIRRCNKFYSISDIYISTTGDYQKNMSYGCKDSEIDKNLNIYTYLNNKIKLDNEKSIDDIKVRQYPMTQITWPKPFDKDTIPNALISELTKEIPNENIKIMKEIPDYIEGKDLYETGCVSNISRMDCLKACLDDDNCRGTEWNPNLLKQLNNKDYEIYKNVCCPKGELTNTITRNDNNKEGKFYAKYVVNKNEIDKNKIIIT